MKIFHLLGLVVLLLSSCDDTSGTYIISEVAFKVNNLSEQEKQKTINEFINQEVLLTVLKGKIELTLSNKPTTSKITLQRVSNNYKLIEYGGTDDKFFSLHMTLDKQ